MAILVAKSPATSVSLATATGLPVRASPNWFNEWVAAGLSGEVRWVGEVIVHEYSVGEWRRPRSFYQRMGRGFGSRRNKSAFAEVSDSRVEALARRLVVELGEVRLHRLQRLGV